jgi:hypothetical protein
MPVSYPPAARGRWYAAAAASLAAALLAPQRSQGLEPRFDHRELRGPQVEAVAVRDVVWTGSAQASTSVRGAVRVAWGFDPTGDGDEIFVGTTVTAVDLTGANENRVRLTFDGRYRACVGTEELKTVFDLGIWVSAADRLAAGPLVGVGLMYDFSRNIGLLASGFVGAAIGRGRVFSAGGGIGINYRFE